MTSIFNFRVPRAAVAAGAVALLLSACSTAVQAEPEPSDSEPQPLTSLSVVIPGIVTDGALLSGIEEGFFEEEGLDIQVSLVQQPPAALAAAQSGEADIAYNPAVPLLNALSQGIGVSLVAPAGGFADGSSKAEDPTEFDGSGLYVSAASGITEISDLEGKTIAVPARRAQNEIVITAALNEAGVDPNSVEWVALDFASSVESLKSGNIDAALLFSPFNTQALDAGASLIGHPTLDFFEEGAIGYWVTGNNTATSKAAAIDAFRRAMNKSNAFANANPDVAMQAGLDFIKSPLTIDQLPVPFWPEEFRASDLERTHDKLVALGFLAAPIALDDIVFDAK